MLLAGEVIETVVKSGSRELEIHRKMNRLGGRTC